MVPKILQKARLKICAKHIQANTEENNLLIGQMSHKIKFNFNTAYDLHTIKY